jgi:ElaB/YqjD/DUF883 family membrane-anchored ribosome-binding protein
MTELTQAHKEHLMGDLRMVISDAEELLRITADQAGQGAADLRGRIAARMQQAKVELTNLQQVAVAKVQAASHAADQYVHDKPWRSIGVAAGVGLVVGLLIGRR